MTYSVSTDRIVRKKTLATFGAFSVFPLSDLFTSDDWIMPLSFFAFFMLLLLFTYLHKPSDYEIDDKDLIIHRFIGDIKINMEQIDRVDRIHHDLLKDTNKGGAFGYFGKIYTFFGYTTWYATRRNNLVMITKKDNTKIILTPDERDSFIEQVESSI